MNGVQIGPDTQKNIEALKKADWLVVGEIYPDETSEFWKAPGTTADEMKKIQTTVYRLPCAGFAEKDGSFTNSARWLQWKNAALPMPGDARLDQDILAQIFLRVRELYQKEGGKFPDPILNAALALHRAAEPVVVGGGARDQRPGARRRHRSGNRPGDQGRPAAARLRLPARRRQHAVAATGSIAVRGRRPEIRWPARGTEDPSGLGIYPNWAWSWPANRRVLYNRASCDPAGKPWDPDATSGLVERSGRTMGRQ